MMIVPLVPMIAPELNTGGLVSAVTVTTTTELIELIVAMLATTRYCVPLFAKARSGVV